MNLIYHLFADNKKSNPRSAKLRSKRFKHFLKIMKVSATSKILDVGGTEATWFADKESDCNHEMTVKVA